MPALASAALPTRALYEQVAEQLRARIFAHALAPGSWIDEQALSVALGISRTPLREALKVLATEGLVTMKLRRGAYVAEVSRDDLAQVYHLLGVLEADAAGVVAERATPGERDELVALHAALEASIADRDAFFAANERFHIRLLEIAANRWRLQMVADLRKVMKLNRAQSLTREGRIEASLREHRQLMAAIKARSAERAQQVMRMHIAAGERASLGTAAPARKRTATA